MDFSAMSESLVARLRKLVPQAFEDGFCHDSPLMWRERFLQFCQYGNSILASAMERVEGLQTSHIMGLDDSESMETERGFDNGHAGTSRRPFRHCSLGQAVKEKVAAFLADLMLLCDAVAVRVVLHLPMQEARFFEGHPALQEADRRLKFTKCFFPMSTFGCCKQLLGQALQVCDLVLLRHRRSVDSLMAINLPRLLDAMARDLVLQDLDECFMLQRCAGNPYGDPRARRCDFRLEDVDCYVTRSTGSTIVVPRPHCGVLCLVCLAFLGWILGLLSRRCRPQCWTLSERIALSDPESLNSNSMKSKSAKKDDKKNKKEKKDTKGDKKKKKKGSSSDEENDEDSSESSQSSQGLFSEIQAMFCLRQKDLARQSGQDKMDDLTTRQIAFVISGAGAGSYLAAADLQEIGGELEAVHSDRAQHVKKTKQKVEENQATAQAALASTLWRKRLAKSCFYGAALLDKFKDVLKKKWRKQELENLLEAEIEKLRKEATSDLQESLTKAKGKDPKPPKIKASKAAVKEEAVKEEEEEGSPKGEDDDEDDEDDCASQKSEASGGAKVKEESADEDQPEQEPAEEEEEADSSDQDLFAGTFARSRNMPPSKQDAGTKFDQLSPQLKKQAQSIEQSVLKSLPKDIPQQLD
ncbi:unnamed protein product [Symbiodinium sp. CCMP2456]|nr:unnamed protein product [Symbiodinium sp. CCMP2456]